MRFMPRLSRKSPHLKPLKTGYNAVDIHRAKNYDGLKTGATPTKRTDK